jgi:poly-gamma-glutamate synthesis protein (capsule biosynthesis protein)
MKPFFDKADVRFCNQATPAGGEFFGITGYPVFNAPFAFTTNLVKLGCNVVNIGTNHTNDKGQRLIDATVDEWSKQDVLAYAGANRSSEEQNKVPTFEREGVKFAFLSYTTYSNTKPATSYGINMYNAAKAKTQLAAARKAADIVIVSMRWGTEYSAEINFEQNKIAQDLADFGADIMLGHGPHVLQPVKRLKANGRETIVWFSLGNFLNSQIDIESLVGGLAIMDVDTATKKVTSVSFLPVYQHYEWTAAEKKREDLLTRHNFMMVPLDGAAGLLAKSQHSTTVEAQAARVKSVLNDFTAIPIINSSQY